MRKLIFDLDGVIVDFVPGLCKEHNLLTGDNLKPEDITNWNLPDFGIDDATWIIPGFFRNLKPVPGAIRTLEAHHYESHYHFIIATDTMGLNFVQREKAAWLQEYLPWIDEVYYLSNKALVPGEVLIDDAPHHLIGFPRTKVKYLHPYNLGVDADYIVKDWGDIDRLLKNGL